MNEPSASVRNLTKSFNAAESEEHLLIPAEASIRSENKEGTPQPVRRVRFVFGKSCQERVSLKRNDKEESEAVSR